MTSKPTAVAMIPKAPTAIVTMYEAITKNVNKNENKVHQTILAFFRMIPEKYLYIKNPRFTFLTIITNEQDGTATRVSCYFIDTCSMDTRRTDTLIYF